MDVGVNVSGEHGVQRETAQDQTVDLGQHEPPDLSSTYAYGACNLREESVSATGVAGIALAGSANLTAGHCHVRQAELTRSENE